MILANAGCGSAVLNTGSGGNGGGSAGAGGHGGGAGASAAGTSGGGAAGAAGGVGGGNGGAAGKAGAGGGGNGGAAGKAGAGGGGGGCGLRDCTSTRDNDCNGTPDNQDTACATCIAGNTVACSTGMSGVCATGVQTCQLAADHQSVSWGTCVQTVAKGARDCTSNNDNDCNGQPDDTETTFCQCSPSNSPRSCSTGLSGICMAGSQACVVASDKTTSAWGTCTQIKAKGTETCANPGTDDDCDGVLDNVPSAACNVGTGMGACANGGYTGCSGTTQVCNAAVSGIGDVNSTTWHTNPAPNGSWDWNCDGVVTKEYPDSAPTPPACSSLSMTDCPNQPPLNYALNPFACGDTGDIGSEYCYWLAAIPGCTNKTGTSTGYQQGCR
ncbi:MAG TPA: hypothetical protein VMT03_00650 [Polyangia bacterium]|nr:hypothetical protein [Polyangia bacterium]